MAELDVKQRQAGDVTILDCSGSSENGRWRGFAAKRYSRSE